MRYLRIGHQLNKYNHMSQLHIFCEEWYRMESRPHLLKLPLIKRQKSIQMICPISFAESYILCVFMYLIFHQFWDILISIIIQNWKRNQCWLKFHSKFACKNLERMLVHVCRAYGKYGSGISPSCIILSISQAHFHFSPWCI
jgi:hypothetical protein